MAKPLCEGRFAPPEDELPREMEALWGAMAIPVKYGRNAMQRF